MAVTAIDYRRDIDGLRAVAILSVVGYHVGLPGADGGFVGVDVFFVISGFLITRLLLKELVNRGSIDLRAFFARRVRRLLPAFIVVVAATLLLGAFFLVPVNGEQTDLAASAAAAAVYLANIHFAFMTGGYFDRPSELMPLLHTWSLAVEEQFYVVWPLALLACAAVARRSGASLVIVVAIVLGGTVVASLVYSMRASGGDGWMAQMAFFTLPSRAWELAIGALLAVAMRRRPDPRPWAGLSLAGGGLVVIGVAIAGYDDTMAFPGVAALAPTLGAAAIIAGGALAPRSLVSRVLSTAPMVMLGAVSYSWYLWHWPLLALARAHELGATDLRRDAAMAAAALVLAGLTYIMIEKPIRTRVIWGNWGASTILRGAATATLVLIAGAGALHAYSMQLAKGVRFERLDRAAREEQVSETYCYYGDDEPFVRLDPRSDCLHGEESGKKKIVVLWGDSHADHFAGMIEEAIKPHGLALLAHAMSACPPLLRQPASENLQEDCIRFNRAMLAEIERAHKRRQLVSVILSARWANYIDPPEIAARGSERMPERYAQASGSFARAFTATLEALANMGVKTIVIAPIPQQQFDAFKCLARKSVRFCSIDLAEANRVRAGPLSIVRDATANIPSVRLWDPLPALCDTAECLVERGGVVMYRDEDHLSDRGSRVLAPNFSDSVAWILGRTRKGAHDVRTRMSHHAPSHH